MRRRSCKLGRVNTRSEAQPEGLSGGNEGKSSCFLFLVWKRAVGVGSTPPAGAAPLHLHPPALCSFLCGSFKVKQVNTHFDFRVQGAFPASRTGSWDVFLAFPGASHQLHRDRSGFDVRACWLAS